MQRDLVVDVAAIIAEVREQPTLADDIERYARLLTSLDAAINHADNSPQRQDEARQTRAADSAKRDTGGDAANYTPGAQGMPGGSH